MSVFLVLAAVASVAMMPQGQAARQSAHLLAEAVRLRAHFDSVRVELLGADVTALTPSQRRNRAQLVAWLREYRDAGAFPLNDGYAAERVPIFRDRDGTLCAMAYLIDRSGRGDIVDVVARERNLGYIPDLAVDPRLRSWLDSTGLTVAEAARIQPTYGPRQPPQPEPAEAFDGGYAFASVASTSIALTTGALNLGPSSRTRGWAGVVAGAMSAALGTVEFRSTSRINRNFALADVVIGGAAVAVGAHALLRPASRAMASGHTADAGLRMSPVLWREGGQGHAGVMLQSRF